MRLMRSARMKDMSSLTQTFAFVCLGSSSKLSLYCKTSYRELNDGIATYPI